MSEFSHVPIMVEECLQLLNLRDNAVIVDCTLGGGGHSKEILKQSNVNLIAVDKDTDAIAAAKVNLQEYIERITFVKSDFKDVSTILSQANVEKVDGVLMDLGVSSYQLDNYERGFSYRAEEQPLDMRMDKQQSFSAYDVINSYSLDQLTKILRDYGEEKFAYRIASNILKERSIEPLQNCGQLVKIIYDSIPAAARRTGGHPAKRTFQAIRIEVNGELENLKKAVSDWIKALSVGGRIAIITFHSLEDRIVKHVFKEFEIDCICDPHSPICNCKSYSIIKTLTKKPIEAKAEEQKSNPRAQSAKLRAAERTENLKGGKKYHVDN